MKHLGLSVIWAALAVAQSTYINVGGPADPPYIADTACGGVPWGPVQQPELASQPAIFRDLKYSPSFSCEIPVMPGIYAVTLLLMEPNKTAQGQRLFTVTVNGHQSPSLDLFKLRGKLQAYELSFFVNVESTIHINLQASIGNAVLSGLIVKVWMPSGWVVTAKVRIDQVDPALVKLGPDDTTPGAIIPLESLAPVFSFDPQGRVQFMTIGRYNGVAQLTPMSIPADQLEQVLNGWPEAMAWYRDQ